MDEIQKDTERNALVSKNDENPNVPITVVQEDGKANIILDMSSWDLLSYVMLDITCVII
jgi:hypothetical protein